MFGLIWWESRLRWRLVSSLDKNISSSFFSIARSFSRKYSAMVGGWHILDTNISFTSSQRRRWGSSSINWGAPHLSSYLESHGMCTPVPFAYVRFHLGDCYLVVILCSSLSNSALASIFSCLAVHFFGQEQSNDRVWIRERGPDVYELREVALMKHQNQWIQIGMPSYCRQRRRRRERKGKGEGKGVPWCEVGVFKESQEV